MRKIILLIPVLLAQPALAENETAPSLNDLDALMEEFGDIAKPFLDRLTETIGPALKDFAGRIPDLTEYEAPEILPNGDIIIRKKLPISEDGIVTEL